VRKEDVDADLSQVAFTFFYWFSRFEFALKENGYLKSHQAGATAEPGWDDFCRRWGQHYSTSKEASVLLGAPPDRQIVLENDELDWTPVGLGDCRTHLEMVVRLLKTVRNNPFHGGKHGGAEWDDPKRTYQLLAAGKSVLDQLAQLASLEADYTQHY
jgi:hypothetical protein